MIDLSQYPKYQRDIQGKHTNIYPIVRIDENLHISTVKESIDGVQYFDYGLSVTNVKESINISKRNFKISNVSLSLNNYPNDENRLSDTIYNYINKYVEIFYKSQSCDTLSDCLPVYRGLLKTINYNDKTITLTLEDLTEKTLHKDVPIANLGYSENVYSKDYKNREIPITYGKVNKAPAVIYRDGNSSEGRIYVISDNVFGVNNPPVEIKGFEVDDISLESNEMGNIESPFYIYKDDYFRVLPDATTSDFSIGSDFDEQDQFRVSLDNNSIYIDKKYKLTVPINPPSDNYLECARVAFPNDIKILKSEPGETFESDEGHTVSLINPTSNSLESIIDNPEVQNEFILDEENFLNTQGQVPNNELTIDNTVDFDNYIVHEFTPHRNGDHMRNRLWYPQSSQLFAPIFQIAAWCWASAHKQELNIKFVQFPTADLIKEKVENYLSENNIDLTLKSGRQHYFQPQTRLTGGTRGAWEEENNRLALEQVAVYAEEASDDYEIGDFMYFRTEYYDTETEGLQDATYPSSMFMFTTEPNARIYVGQWSSISMVDQSWLGTNIFLNIFPEEDNDIPSLFNLNDFPVFSPFEKVHESTTQDDVYGMKYRSNWNGVEPNSKETASGSGATCIYGNTWFGDKWGKIGEPIWNTHMCRNYGQSWFMYFPDGIDAEDMMSIPATSDNRYRNSSLNTRIKKHTFIPCNHFQKYYRYSSYGAYESGYGFYYDYALPDNPSQFTLGGGSSTTQGEKLLLSMPFSDLGASDAVEGTTRTFPHGKLNCVFNPSQLDTPNTTSSDEFNVILSGSTIDSETNQVNFTQDTNLSTKLITIQGGDVLNTHDQQGVVWSSISEESDNQFEWDEVEGQITFWDTPDACDSIVLSYSLSSNFIHNVSLETNVSAMGIMQFISFENALDDNVYLDISGRANSIEDIITTETQAATFGGEITLTESRFKYTDDEFFEDSSKVLIENPADVMYHFVEKELGQFNITDRDSWREARNNTDLDLAFSVKEKINSKELFSKISTNCNIIPRFRQNGEFAFTSIKKEYDSSDLTIASDDIVSFELGYTPTSDIYTLVNVKYKKDYEEDEFTKETGYCDGYDFFGNIEGGYDYGYYGLKRDENILEFESDFIRDAISAQSLRDFLYMYHCNHHAIAKVTLPLKYSNLELGDIVQFDKIVNNMKSLGEDYTIENTRNGQTIYPYFMITSVVKSPKQVRIEATQLHKLVRSFTPGIGSLTRNTETNLENLTGEDIVTNWVKLWVDWIILYQIIFNKTSEYGEPLYNRYITSEQKRVADITQNGSISLNDLNVLAGIINLPETLDTGEYTFGGDNEELINLLGDANNDGIINVNDVVVLTELIFSGDYTQEQLDNLDINQDGELSVADLVGLIAQILG